MLIAISGLLFSSINGSGFEQITKSKKGEYTEQALIGGAMSVIKGRPLDKITLTAQWLGLDALSRINDLDVLLTGYHQMSDQGGNNLGLWTLDAYTDNGSDIFGGAAVCHKVTLNLTEYR